MKFTEKQIEYPEKSPPLRVRAGTAVVPELQAIDQRIDQRDKVLEAHKARVARLRVDEAAAIQFNELIGDFNGLVINTSNQ